MRRVVLSILLVAAAAIAATAGAATSTPLQMTPIGRLLFPERGYVVDLPQGVVAAADAFDVRENGRPAQDLEVAPVGSAGIHFGTVLAIDTSGTTSGEPIRAALAAARSFVERRARGQQIGLIAFDSRVHVLVEPTSNSARLERALSQWPPIAYGTHIYDAADRSLAVVARARLSTGSVVLLSDGADAGSTIALSTVLRKARARHVRIFTVGLRSQAFKPRSLQELAAGTGGSYAEASSAKQLASIYEALRRRLANEYVVQYRSHAAPESAVNVTIDVAAVGSTSRSYTAPTPAGLAPFHRSLLSRFVLSPEAVAVLALFVAGVVALVMLLVLRSRASTVVDRVEQFAADQSQPSTPVAPQRLPAAERVTRLEPRSRYERLEQQLAIARIDMSARRVVVLALAATALAMIVLGLISPVFIILALFTPFAAKSLITRRLRKVQDEFAEQLPPNLQVLASALRVGHSFDGALTVVVENAREPSQSELQRVLTDGKLGVPVEEAVRRVADRMASRDLEQVALLAELQRTAGGNSAEVLDTVVETLRERAELRGLIKTLTAQGRMGRWILTALPVVVGLGAWLLQGELMRPLFVTSGGQIALVVATLMVITGSLVIQKIVDINV